MVRNEGARAQLEAELHRHIPDEDWVTYGEHWSLRVENFGVEEAAEYVRDDLDWLPTSQNGDDEVATSAADEGRASAADSLLKSDPLYIRGQVMGRVTVALIMETGIGAAIRFWRTQYLPDGSVMTLRQMRLWIQNEALVVGHGDVSLIYRRRRRLRYIRVPERSSLGELAGLARLLRAEGLTEPDAVEWIVTGRPPWLPPVAIRGMEGRAMKRMIVHVDPSATPSEVAAMWDFLRPSLPVQTKLPEHHMQARHLELAAFHAETRENDQTWDSRRRQWNRRHQDWAYTQVTNFQRDATKALAKLAPKVGLSE